MNEPSPQRIFEEVQNWSLSEWAREEQSNFPLLRRIPSEPIQSTFFYLDTLDKGSKEEFLELHRLCVPSFFLMDISRPPLTSTQRERLEDHSQRAFELSWKVRPPRGVELAGFSDLRKAMGHDLKRLFPDTPTKRSPGGWRFTRSDPLRPFGLSIDPASWSKGFDYRAGIPLERGFFPRGLSYEHLLGFAWDRWNCIRKDCAAEAAATFLEVLGRLEDLLMKIDFKSVLPLHIEWVKARRIPKVHMGEP